MKYHIGLERFQEYDDLTMIKNYSRHYHEWRKQDLKEELHDIYSSSAGGMVFTDDGLVYSAVPVDKLAMSAAATSEQLKQIETRFKRHTDNFKDVMERCTPKERRQVKEYLTAGFKEMFEPFFISERLPSYPVIQRIKKELYAVELKQRRDRHGIDEKIRKQEIEQKAKALARSKLKAYQRGRAWERWWDDERKSGNKKRADYV